MTTRPTDTPDWADAPAPPSAGITKPGTGLRTIGWADFTTPPAAFVNWAWNDFATWAAHMASVSSSFPTLEDAARAPATAPLIVGDSCLIDEDDQDLPGATVLATLDSNIVLADRIDTAGEFVALQAAVTGSPGLWHLFDRDGSGVIQSFDPTNANTNTVRILADGDEFVAVYDDGTTTTVEMFEPDVSGQYVSKWVVTPLTATRIALDIAWDSNRVYIVGDEPGGELIALTRSTGATQYTYDHSGAGVAQLRSVATNGRLVFVAGEASGSGSGATLRGIVAADGFDAAGEGGLGTNALLAWDAVQASLTAIGGVMATDGRRLYVGRGGQDFEARGCGDGVIVQTKAARTSVASVMVDQDYVIVMDGTETVAWDKIDLAEAWRGAGTGFAATDGAAIFTRDGKRLARGNMRPTMFRRVDPTAEPWLPLRQLLVPVSRG